MYLNEDGFEIRKGYKGLYYCGQYIGRKDLPGSNGYCGPSNGPQCKSCIKFQKHRPANLLLQFNSDGYQLTQATTGDYYCGRFIGKFELPGSDGYCGPTNGPQCKSCLQTQAHRPEASKLLSGYFNCSGDPVFVGDYGLFYCGKFKGQLPGSDGFCGPTNGPQCRPCKILQQHQPRLHTLQPHSNSDGAKICIGEEGKFYCGRYLGPRLLGSDGYCGPTNGPQCDPCITLQAEIQRPTDLPAPDEKPNESKFCKICMDKEVNSVFVPCGHTACYGCAALMKSCPFCRNPIGSVVKMFYM